MSPNPIMFSILLIIKVFRVNIRPQFGIGQHENVVNIPLEEVPDEARAHLQLRNAELEPLGFTPYFVRQADSLGNRWGYAQFLLHSDRTVVADVTHCTVEQNSQRTMEETVFLSSLLSNGLYIVTTASRSVPSLKHPIDLKIVRQADWESLLSIHRARLAAQPAAPKLLNSELELDAAVKEMEKEQFEQLIRRRVFVPLNDEERKYIDSIQRKYDELGASGGATKLPPPPADSVPSLVPDMLPSEMLGEKNPAHAVAPETSFATTELERHDVDPPEEMHPEDRSVLTQIHSVNLSSTNWVSKLLLLLVSLAAFAGLGALAWDWYLVAMLIPILFFHELGHYIAMRVLKYRNVKMFFLPLFGAAVQGRNYNAPGWQRAVVALAGPIPGIIVGCAILYLFAGQRVPMLVGVMTIFLNVLNLLPFLPLDGGWVVQTVLFSRNQYLDFFFRAFAVFALGALGFWIGGKIIMGFAVLMAFGLPYQWRVGKLTHQLKREGLRPDPTSHDELCEPTIYEIVKRLRTDSTISLPMRPNAALSVYEVLSARPPGIFASLALLAVQVIAFFGSIVFALWMLNIGVFGGLPQGPQVPQIPEPTAEIASADSVAPANNRKFEGRQPVTFYVQCDNEAQMEKAWQTFQSQEGAAVSRFGKTIVIELQAENDPILEEEITVKARKFDPRSFSNQHSFNVGIEVSFDAETEDDANQLTEQLNQYFFASEYEIAPPWLGGFELTKQQAIARRTLYDLQQLEYDIESDAALEDLLDSAYRKNDQQEILETFKALQEKHNRQRAIAVKKYVDENKEVDQRVIDQWFAMSDGSALEIDQKETAEEFDARYSKQLKTMGEFLGPVPETSDENRRLDYSAPGGLAEVEGRRVNIHQLQCYRPTIAVQAIVKWLEKNGATNIQYSLYDTKALYESMIEQ